ncbi:MAG: dihydrolipoamide dehydrogenase [Acidimicrobiia bacterium]|nr:dihydrolipoamide dehydrogenase [Acidimicrobiia bacterium]
MVVGQIAEEVDVLVIGAGPGGYATALHAAHLGQQVTLVEREAVGGTCLNVGCIPSKTLIEVADLVARAPEAARWGVTLRADVDMKAVQRHLRATVEGLTKGVRTLLDAAGVRVVRGTARLTTADRVVIDAGEQAMHIEFRHLVLATGSHPVSLPGLPVDGRRVLDSTGALALDRLPGSIVVVGGGYIGVELGTAFAKLGSRVTVVEAMDRLLPGLEPSLGRVVGRRLRELGVDVLLSTKAHDLTETELVVQGSDGATRGVPAEVVVVAVGRVPAVGDLGLERAGVKLDERGLVRVDPARRTSNPRVLAIGDLTAGPALAHKATAEALVAALTAARKPASFDPAAIPQVVFSDPEVVSVGATAGELKAAGLEPLVFRFPFGASARARTLDRTTGHVELVADAEQTVVGVHMVGAHVSELAGEAALAIEMAATVEELAGTIHPHPTLSEALAEAAHGALGMPLHVAVQRRR